MQEELIKSEEERLTVSQALLTMQLDLNKAQVHPRCCQSGFSMHIVLLAYCASTQLTLKQL